MATIRKRDGSWQAQVRRQGHPLLSKTFRLKSDAQAWARKVEGDIEHGDRIVSRKDLERVTLKALLTRYEAEVSPGKRAADREHFMLRVLGRHRFADLPLSRLTSAVIAQYRDDRLSEVSGPSVRRELSLLRHCLEVARREWGYPLTPNPVAQIKLPSPSRPRTRRLEGEEEARLLQAAQCGRSPYLGPLITLAIETGMRRGELLSLQWDNIDWTRRLAHLPLTKNGHSRDVPLSTQAVAVLKALQTTQGQSDSRVFPQSANAVRQAWERLRQRVGLADFHFHDLRHEAVSRFFEKGLDTMAVATISGHREIRMLQRYTHLRPEDLVDHLG